MLQLNSWGRGQSGRLGLNSEEDQCSPKEVELKTDDIYITNVECGADGTIFISHEGDLYACGNNENNKLGLNDQNGWVFSGEVKQALVPTRIKAVKQKTLYTNSENYIFILRLRWTICVLKFRKNQIYNVCYSLLHKYPT